MNSNIKICVVGAGEWGMNHIKTLDNLGFLGGVVDKNLKLLRNISKNFSNCEIFSDLNESLNRDFDGFIVATPPISHFSIAEKIIKNNIPVLVEKPLTLDYQSAIKLNKLAKKNRVNLMVGHVLLFHPAFIKMKELIDDGILGDIQYIYSNRLNLGTFRVDENIFWSFAPHDISLFNFFLNEEPASITSRGIDLLQKGIHDTSVTSFRYGSNKMGHIFVSWLHPFKEHRFVIIGTKGMLHFEDSLKNKPLIFYNKKAEFINSVPSPFSGDKEKIQYENSMPLTNELKYFIKNLRNTKIDKANGDSACDVIKILERATLSLNKN